MKSFIPFLILLASLAGGCGKNETTVPSSKSAQDVASTENAGSVTATDSGSRPSGKGSAIGSNSNLVDQQISAVTSTQAEALTTISSTNDVPMQNMDSKLQDMLRNFHTTGDRAQRSTIATDIGKLADAGVPKPQVASALGYLFRDENSTDVKTDILSELGALGDPSAFNQVVAGLDQYQPDEVHLAAIEALDDLGDKRAIPLIQPFLTDRDDEVRDSAQSTIDSLNNP